MSSSSKAPARQQADEAQATDSAWLGQLLAAMAKEWSTLGVEITGVGDALSSRVFAKGEMQGVKEMQAFDALSQLAHAQAGLLSSICTQLNVPAEQMRPLLEARIAELPISTVRQRMMRAINSQEASELGAPTAENVEDAIQWFE